MVTIALSISVLVFVVLCMALVAVLAATFREVDRLSSERDALVSQARDASAAKSAYKDAVRAMEIAQADARGAKENADYHATAAQSWKKRADALTEWGRAVLTATSLASQTEEGDPLDIRLDVIDDCITALATNNQRLLDVCTQLGATPDDANAQLQASLVRATANSSVLLQVEHELAVDNRDDIVTALKRLKAERDEKAGKLNHYRTVIDDALGGIRCDGERWSAVHVEAIKELKVKADAADASGDQADHMLSVVEEALGIKTGLRDANPSDESFSWKSYRGGAKLARLVEAITLLRSTVRQRNQWLREIALAVGAPDSFVLADNDETATVRIGDLMTAVSNVQDLKQELAEAEEAGSEALEKAVAAEELRGELAKQIDAINATLGVMPGLLPRSAR